MVNGPPSSPMKLSRSPSSYDMLPTSFLPISTGNNNAPGMQTGSSPPFGQAPLRRVSTAPAQFQPLPPPSPPSPNAISTALFVSSCPKLFPILLVIWGSKESEVPEEGSSAADSPAATMLHKTLATVTKTLSSEATPLPLLGPSMGSGPSGTTTTGTSVSAPFYRLFSSAISSFELPSLFSFLSMGVANTHLVLLNNIEALYILIDCGYLRAVALAVAGQLARWTVERLMLGLFGIR